MGKIFTPMVFAMLVGLLIFVGTMSSAETLSFSQSATVGNMSNPALDIVKIGGFTSGEYQYFYAETRSSGLATPPDGSTYQFTIYVNANVNGAEEEQYLLILLSWTNNGGSITHIYRYSVENSGSSPLESGDVVISGNKITVRVPATLLSDVTVDSVKFITVNYNTAGTDMATYYTQSGANGGDNNDGDTSNSTVPDDTGVFAFLGLGLALVCGAIFFIIWLVLAIWAYKDAKRRGMDAPIVWFLVVFFLGIIGLIIYLIVRPKEVPQNTNVPPPPPPPA